MIGKEIKAFACSYKNNIPTYKKMGDIKILG
jgi:hypothetical protein